MKELTFAEFCELPMQYTLGFNFDTHAQRMYRNDKHGLQKEVFTKRNVRMDSWGTGSVYYFLDGDPRQFDTIDQVYVAYMEKVCGVKEVS